VTREVAVVATRIENRPPRDVFVFSPGDIGLALLALERSALEQLAHRDAIQAELDVANRCSRRIAVLGPHDRGRLAHLGVISANLLLFVDNEHFIMVLREGAEDSQRTFQSTPLLNVLLTRQMFHVRETH
jgi:hypothetical protein